jgi:hypothetical protein
MQCNVTCQQKQSDERCTCCRAHGLLVELTGPEILLRKESWCLQTTVNNQIVVGTLMNICDDPNHVSIYQAWREDDVIQRVPIIVTGNDLSQIFAPLVRDGRMSKFYWKPGRHDLSCILHQMYKVRASAKCSSAVHRSNQVA